MAINFPTSPALNELYTYNSKTWFWNGTGWQIKANTLTISSGTGIDVTYPTSNNATISLTTSGVSSGTYGNTSSIPQVTVDTYGRITAISNTAISIPAGTSIVANSGQLTANASTGIVALGLATTDVVAKTYGDGANVASFTVDTYGRITSVSNTAITVGASISDDTSSNSSYYPLFITTTSGTLSAVNVSSTKLNYNPSTGTLSTSSLSANNYSINGSQFIGSNRAITQYGSTHNALGSGSGNRTIDLSLGNFVSATVAGTTTWTFSNALSSPAATGFVLQLTNGGSATQNWPSVKWPGGTAPTLTASGIDVLTFFTNDGGTTWRGVVSMLDSK